MNAAVIARTTISIISRVKLLREPAEAKGHDAQGIND